MGRVSGISTHHCTPKTDRDTTGTTPSMQAFAFGSAAEGNGSEGDSDLSADIFAAHVQAWLRSPYRFCFALLRSIVVWVVTVACVLQRGWPSPVLSRQVPGDSDLASRVKATPMCRPFSVKNTSPLTSQPQPTVSPVPKGRVYCRPDARPAGRGKLSKTRRLLSWTWRKRDGL